MFIPQCLFCHHTNPAAAKFCNECGSPLHLKPCRQCEAINDATAKTCYKCGTADPALVITPEAAAAMPDVDSMATATPGDVSFERERLSLPEPIAESQDVRLRWPAGDATARDAESEVEAVVCAPQSSGTQERSLVSETLDATPAVVSQTPGATAKRRPRFRVAMAALAPVLLLSAVAVLAYYAYRDPVQLREWLSAARETVSPSDGAIPMPSAPGTSSAPASYAPVASVDTPSVAAMEPAAPRPANEPATDITLSPVRQDSESATGAAGDDGRPPTTNPADATVTSPPQVSTREPATAARTSRAEKKSSTGTKTTAKKSKKTSTRKPAPARATPLSNASTGPLLALQQSSQ